MELYNRLLDYPRFLLAGLALLCLLAAWYNQQFSFDASSDTLVVEGDPQLAQYIRMSSLFPGDDFIVLVYQPRGELLAAASLETLAEIQSELAALPGIAATTSVLDVPLLRSPSIPLEALADGYRTLRSDDVDFALAKEELTTSPMFRNHLIAENGRSTAIRLSLAQDTALTRITLAREQNPGPANESQYRRIRDDYLQRREQLIDDVRAVRDRHANEATLYISGVPMIAADMISFVRNDLATFGALVVFIIVLLLWVFFRRPRWVVLPLVISIVSTWLTTGVLGFVVKPVTVISSNFISLLAILCISFSIHLIVRYRELLQMRPDYNHGVLVRQTMVSKFAPCLYTALTTMFAFGSMMASGIVPVEDFGWMMCLGIVISFLVTYTLFPASLLVLGKGTPSKTLGAPIAMTDYFSNVSRHAPFAVLAAAALVAVVAVTGLSRITFDNRFVDYFSDKTDINRGMVFIDKHLGGTLPFDVYLQLGAYDVTQAGEDSFFGGDEEAWEARYWFTRDRLDRIEKVHDFVAAHPAVGKVMSVVTLERVARDFNDGEKLNGPAMAFILGEIPEDLKAELVLPYALPETGFARLSIRVMESGPAFSREDLIRDIRAFARDEAGIAEENVIVTGMMVLFNDMLQQLADSQRETLTYVIGATFFMFALLLRSLLLALLALVPNVLAAATVVSVMGYAGIPLDMMTITIAAICIGIGVDDAIHYLHRFREEKKRHGVREAVAASHASIGRAMYFTTLVIVAGFSILVMSNFLPTVYFGTLTAIAMVLAFLANLVVLPSLLVAIYGFRDPPA